MKKAALGLGFLLLMGLVATAALAGPGWRHGWGGRMMGPGYGGHMMGYGPWQQGAGCAWDRPYGPVLSEEQAKKLDQARQKFWEETRPLRDSIFEKQQQLQRLYAEKQPDKAAIDALEKEIFDLGQQLRERQFAFSREAREIAPGYRTWGRYGGWHRGPMMGGAWGGHMMGGYGWGRGGFPCYGYD